MPIPLGILAAAGFRPPAAGGSYDLLETVSLSSSAASVSFSSLNTLAAGYKHLQVRYVTRGTAAIQNRELRIRFNGDDATNYSAHTLSAYSDGTLAVRSEAAANTTFARVGAIPAASLDSNIFGAGVIDILDAFVGTKNPTVRTLYGFMGGTASFSQEVGLTSGSRRNIAALTSLTIFAVTGDLAANSRFSLYGVK
jgi:hypothetical protein